MVASLSRWLITLGLALLGFACGDDAPNAEKEIGSYGFLAATNPGLSADAPATISGRSIAVTLPAGTDVTGLVATFTTTGTSVTVATMAQVSGVTANDFTETVEYTVTAADGSDTSYLVQVTLAEPAAKEITALSFTTATNSGLPADVTATINGSSIAATVPSGTDVTALVATFSTTGQNVTVGSTVQVSGTTANDFTSPVSYVVAAADASTRVYTVTVTIAASTAKDLTAFSFLTAHNAGLSADVVATINGTAIAATLPFGTDPGALITTFSSTGTAVHVGATAQVSNVTANDFATPVMYTVTAADSSTKIYTVTVTIAASPAKDLTAFSLRSVDNPDLPADAIGVITGNAISLAVPFGTDPTTLVAMFTSTGAMVSVGGTPQTSGSTSNDFTSPVTYTVTAADLSTNDYLVTVVIAASPAKDLTSFSFASAVNAALSLDVTATISGTAISATVPFGTDVTALIATFATTGASVRVGGTIQTSGITPNDFTNPVVYTVTAADSSTQDFTITISIAPGDAKDLTAFAFLSSINPALSTDVTATITGTTIDVVVPFATDVIGLIATFSTTGQSVEVGATVQASGITPNDFTSSVTYRVYALDTTFRDFVVTVTIAPPATCDPLTSPTGGSVSVTNGGVFPSTATYTCDLGRLINPTSGSIASCDSDGHWTPAAPPTCDLSIMVVRVGDGVATLDSASTQVVVQERRITDGEIGRTITLPIVASGLNHSLTIGGSANAEAHLSLSSDRRYVTIGGYATGTGTAAVAGTTTVAVQRVIGRIDAAGLVDTSTRLDFTAVSSIRGATTSDGTGFWATGSNCGVRYVPLGGAGASTIVYSAIANLRAVHTFDGQLYTSTDSMSPGVLAIGAGLPITVGQVGTPVVAATAPHSFAFLDLDNVVVGVDTLYIALNGTPGPNAVNIQKWTFNGLVWTQVTGFQPALTGTNSGTLGLTAFVEGGVVHVVAATAVGASGANNQLVTFTDDGSTLTPAVTPLGTAGTSFGFRGVARPPTVP